MARRNRGREIDGIFILNKPIGLSSNQALQKVKRLANIKKAGHTGALDPLASGVLPLCFGEATKLSQRLLESRKTYVARICLGETRSTGDAEGEVVDRFDVPELTIGRVNQALAIWTGDIIQTPPAYSALKYQGKPLYWWARTKQAVDLNAIKRRQVTIYRLELLKLSEDRGEVDVLVDCSTGTYIRSLAQDIAYELGTGGYVSYLHRTKAGPYDESQSISLARLEKSISEKGLEGFDQTLFHPSSAIADWPSVELSEELAHLLLQGQAISEIKTDIRELDCVQLWVLTKTSRIFIGIAQKKEHQLFPKRMFNVNIK